MSIIRVNAELCQGCGRCVEICPGGVLEQGAPGAPPEAVRNDLCIACGHCLAICPDDALRHVSLSSEAIGQIDETLLPSGDQVFELIRARRSIRTFRGERVEKELVQRVIDAAHFAPSAHNFQGTEFTVVQDRTVLDDIVRLTVSFLDKTRKQLRNPLTRALFGLIAANELKGALPLLPDFDMVVEAANAGKDPILRGAPCLILFHADPAVSYPDKSAQLALHNATLAAQAFGLGSFYTGYVVGACERDKRIPRSLSLPRRHRVYGGMALGYPKLKFSKWVDRKPARITWR